MFGNAKPAFSGFGTTPFGGGAATTTPNTGFGGGGGFGGNTGFGGTTAAPGGFGAPAGGATTGFGATTGATGFGGGATTGLGGFGAPAATGGFGAAPAATGGLFGGGAATTGNNLFGGAAAPAQNTGGFGGFGGNTAAPAGGFGATPFGGAQPAATTGGFGAGGFGGAPATTGAFGTPAANTGFGGQTGGFGTTATTGGMFGGAAKTGFGATGATPFGGTATPFGGQPANTNTFGQPSTGLGGATTGGFGTGGFGTSTATASSPFAPKPAGGGLFGGASTTTGGFGSTTTAGGFGTGATTTTGAFSSPFGKSTAGAFGQPAATGTTFGSPFGNAAGTNSGTRAHPYKPTLLTENSKNGTVRMNLQVITGMKEFENKTLEELRYEDYMLTKGGAPPSLAAPTGTGAFTPNPLAVTPASTMSGFGATPATAGGFGGFGSSAPAAGGFGGFGAPAAATNTAAGGFGGFGTTPAAGTTGGFGGFGSTTGTGTSTGFGGFGGASATNTTGQPGGFGGFGTGATNTSGFGTGGGFGSTTTGFGTTPAPATGFGQSTTGTGFGGFGTSAPSTTGTTSGFGGFGNTTGTTPATGTTTSGFGGGTLGGFGSTTGGFGTTTGGFGTTTATTGFGTGATGTTVGFGSTLGGGFGSPGAKPATTGFGGFGTTTGGFGTTTAGGFGTTPATTGTTGGFGSTLGGGFGSSTGGFGTTSAPTTAPSTGFGGFGTTPSTNPAGGFGTGGFSTGGFGGFGTSTTNTSFGQPAAGASMFGQPAATTAPATQTTAPAMTTTTTTLNMDQRIDLLVKKKDELLSNGNGNATSTSKSLDQDASHKTAPSILFAGVGNASALNLSRSSPSAHAKILPRGLRASQQAGSSLSNRGSAVSTAVASLLSPAAAIYRGGIGSSLPASSVTPSSNLLIQGSAKKLVISSTFGSSLPTMDELPTAPSAASTTTKPPIQTPLRSTLPGTPGGSAMAVASASSTGGRPSSSLAGEATGLTPSKDGTPIASRLSIGGPSHGANKRESLMPLEHEMLTPSKSNGLHSAGSMTPIIESESQMEREQRLPILEREDYFTSPDISVLRQMSLTDLSKVKNFTIFRPNVGKIEWEGTVDLRDMNLDEIVRIEHKEVFVYEGAGVVEPVEGEGLNKPAIITLYNVFPKHRDGNKTQKFVDKLHAFCQDNDAEFVSYDGEIGEWVFAVKHFSRYGLGDDSDEDDGAVVNAAGRPVTESKSMKESTASLKENLTNNHQQSASKMDAFKQKLDESTSTIKQLKSILLKEHSNVAAAGATTPGSINKKRFGVAVVSPGPVRDISPSQGQLVPATPYHEEKMQYDEEDSGAIPDGGDGIFPEDDLPIYHPRSVMIPYFLEKPDTLQKPVPKFQILSPDKDPEIQQLRAAKKAKGVADWMNYTRPLEDSFKSLEDRKKMSDIKLAMGRSFRVSFTADGRLVHPGRQRCCNVNTVTATQSKASTDNEFGSYHRVTIEPVFPTLAVANSVTVEARRAIMEDSCAMLQKASVFSSSTSGAGLYRHPKCNASDSDMEQYVAFVTLIHELKNYLNQMITESIQQGREGITSPEKHPYWSILKAIELFHAVVGQEKFGDSLAMLQDYEVMDLYEARSEFPEHWERRRVALSKWFEQLTEHMVASRYSRANTSPNTSWLGAMSTPTTANPLTTQSSKDIRHIFELLSVNKVTEAVVCLQEANLHKLALLVSQLGSDSSTIFLIRNQLELWSSLDKLNQIPEDILVIYILLGGLLKVDDQKPSIIKGLGWQRALGMLFWYYGESDSPAIAKFSDVLMNFEELMQLNEVDSPLSPFLHPKRMYGKKKDDRLINDGLFSLLRVLFPSSSSTNEDMVGSASMMEMDIDGVTNDSSKKEEYVLDALHPEAYLRDETDYFSVYLVNNLLECTGHTSSSSTSSLIIRNHVISQLLAFGSWKWAIFVAMQIPQEEQRTWLVRDILDRYSGHIGWEDAAMFASSVSSSSGATSMAADVMKSFELPEEWIHESTAIMAGYHFLFKEQVNYFAAARQWKDATTALITRIIPQVILADSSSSSISSKTYKDLVRVYELLSSFHENSPFNENPLKVVNKARRDTLRVVQGGRSINHSFSSEMKLAMIVLDYLIVYTGVREEREKEKMNEEEEDPVEKMKSLQLSANEILSHIASFEQHGYKFHLYQDIHNEKLISQMMQSISSYIYRLLTNIDVKGLMVLPSESHLLDAKVLKHVPVRKDFVLEAWLGNLNNFLQKSAESVKLVY